MLYGGCYTKEMLKTDARAIRKWLKEGKDVFVFFNNDAGGYVVRNALELNGMLKRA